MAHGNETPEQSLDPQDWGEIRALGHRMVDEMLDLLEHVRDEPVWKPMPDEVRARLRESVPLDPLGAEAAYEDFRRDVLPYRMGSIHPRFWGWVIGTGTPLGMLADMLASGLNPNVGGADHSAPLVETQVIDWLKTMLGYPAEASGLLVSGGSMANFVGLAVARHARAGFDVRKLGLQSDHPRLVLYASNQTHSSVQRAVELLGLGSDSLRFILVNADYQIEIAALEAAIAQDRAAGYRPFCIVGNAGTVGVGAFDDLNTLADISAREGLWFHVDGAFGALAALSPELSHLTSGMERADSVAFDLHKWMYIPFEAGCTLVHDRHAHYQTFTLTPDYLKHATRGLAAGEVWLSDLGVQLSRGFRALKVWMSLKEHGSRKYGEMVRQNVAQAAYLAELVEAAPQLENLAPVPLNIVCLRYKADGLDESQLNALNEELLIRVHESGVAVPSTITIAGKSGLRVCITNHRTTRADLDLFVREVVRMGEALAAEMMAQPV